MADLNKLFPSKFLSAPDLKGKKVTATIKSVVIEKFDDSGRKVEKPIIYFKDGGEKGLVCNKTNAMTVARITGKTDTDDWVGARVTLFGAMVQFGGKVTEAIRIEKPDEPIVAAVTKPIPTETPPTAAVQGVARELDDDIPW